MKTSTALEARPGNDARASHENRAAVLTVTDLAAGYGTLSVLADLSFSLRASEIVAVLGSNGSGKTTLLRALSGMITARGSVVLAGHPIAGLAPDRIAALGMAHVPEGRGTFAELTVEDNLQLGAWLRHDRSAALDDRARLLENFPRLRERLRQQAGTLSGGEQQMLAIARALLSRPKVLLLDEPSFGLAPKLVLEVFEILRKLRKDYGVAMILVEQHPALALDLADRAFLLDQGHLAEHACNALPEAGAALRSAYLGY